MTESGLKINILGKPIDIKILNTDRGLNVLIAGGDSAHIGAVSIAAPGLPVSTTEFPGHRDGTVSEKWASALTRRFEVPVVVSCGIHYDEISKEKITEVVSALEDILENIEI